MDAQRVRRHPGKSTDASHGDLELPPCRTWLCAATGGAVHRIRADLYQHLPESAEQLPLLQLAPLQESLAAPRTRLRSRQCAHAAGQGAPDYTAWHGTRVDRASIDRASLAYSSLAAIKSACDGGEGEASDEQRARPDCTRHAPARRPLGR